MYIFSGVATKRIESKTLSLTVCYTAVDSTFSQCFRKYSNSAPNIFDTLHGILLWKFVLCHDYKQCKLDKIFFTVVAQGIGIVLLQTFVSCTVFLV